MKKSMPFIMLAVIAVALVQCKEKKQLSGEVELKNPSIKLVTEAEKMTAGFVTIVNGTDKTITLTSAESDISEVVELHEMVHENDMMKMRKIEKIEIASGETSELKPGGNHIMFINMTRYPAEGETVKVNLNFESFNREIEAVVKNVHGDMNHEMKH